MPKHVAKLLLFVILLGLIVLYVARYVINP